MERIETITHADNPRWSDQSGLTLVIVSLAAWVEISPFSCLQSPKIPTYNHGRSAYSDRAKEQAMKTVIAISAVMLTALMVSEASAQCGARGSGCGARSSSAMPSSFSTSSRSRSSFRPAPQSFDPSMMQYQARLMATQQQVYAQQLDTQRRKMIREQKKQQGAAIAAQRQAERNGKTSREPIGFDVDTSTAADGKPARPFIVYGP